MREYLAGTTVNVAVTVLSQLIETVQVSPETAVHPVQLVNVDPAAGIAVIVAVEPVT